MDRGRSLILLDGTDATIGKSTACHIEQSSDGIDSRCALYKKIYLAIS